MEMSKKEKELWFKSLLKEHLRLLDLYEKRKHYLETMDTSLELVRMVLQDDIPNEEKLRLIQTYRKHFDNKIQTIKEEIVRIENRDDEILDAYM